MKLFPRVNLSALIFLAAREIKSLPITTEFTIANGYLDKIAHRAIELDDLPLLSYLYQIGCINSDSEEEVQKFKKFLEESSGKK